MPPVRILLDGLMDSGRIWRAGEVAECPSSRLLELAAGELLDGQLVAEPAEAVPSEPVHAELQPEQLPVTHKKSRSNGKRRKTDEA